MAEKILPISHFKSGFTTCDALKADNLTHVELEDKALGIHRVSSRTTHKVVSPPPPCSKNWSPPSQAWEAFYPKGSINPKSDCPGGFGFYLSGPASFSSLLEKGAKEVVMSYRMMLAEDWEWVRGGKLPGFFGGEGQLAYSCTGGRQEDRCKCFDMRPMWRRNGVGELYTYLPPVEGNTKVLKSVPPQSIENSNFGFSVGRGAYKWEKAVGNWVAVACRIKLNDVGYANGEVEVWIDGERTINIAGLKFRDSEKSIIKGMHFETFFGGHSAEWASPKDQRAWFADVTGVIVQ
ncbi:hypothetical protein AGABI2DRAFT_203648 [Agaricus bisporus var. bisporus H97]|uniref:hypothetical protein n=1 Tax=Agaricus bisporus var. bisporus (strain H97 / ATCC MYA-4626 / FGSC 10389) TaxID=936046 RepID=UPI00029F594E|nr:hypothetical protein AGABI2DRAFT_203648 [Agaricus bisporus var. bisporus H97]EKV48704.1 hypothetical protein AGABI2DRAFT_203648 [Agaricus bisporus var. bisporus H97]